MTEQSRRSSAAFRVGSGGATRASTPIIGGPAMLAEAMPTSAAWRGSATRPGRGCPRNGVPVSLGRNRKATDVPTEIRNSERWLESSQFLIRRCRNWKCPMNLGRVQDRPRARAAEASLKKDHDTEKLNLATACVADRAESVFALVLGDEPHPTRSSWTVQPSAAVVQEPP
jgi:hypothetical protein